MNQKPNAAEELGYPAWVYPFAAFVIFIMGCVVIYAAVSFISLTIYFNEWSTFLRVLYCAIVFLWGEKAFDWAADAVEE